MTTTKATILPHHGVEPQFGEGSWVAPGACIIGDTILGSDCNVWFNTVLRGDVNYIRVGDRTNVQDNSTLHVTSGGSPCLVGNDVTVGHNVLLHACTIGDRCLIGMGAIVLDDAEIGADCLVGAGSLVTQGKKFPPGSLIMGSPAKVIRPLTDEEKAKLLVSAKHYVDLAKTYA